MPDGGWPGPLLDVDWRKAAIWHQDDLGLFGEFEAGGGAAAQQWRGRQTMAPALPVGLAASDAQPQSGHGDGDVPGLEQVDQLALGRQDRAAAATHRRPHIPRLAGLLRDDDLAGDGHRSRRRLHSVVLIYERDHHHWIGGHSVLWIVVA